MMGLGFANVIDQYDNTIISDLFIVGDNSIQRNSNGAWTVATGGTINYEIFMSARRAGEFAITGAQMLD